MYKHIMKSLYLYYWDVRRGGEAAGWWVGENLGPGGEVFHHPATSWAHAEPQAWRCVGHHAARQRTLQTIHVAPIWGEGGLGPLTFL